MEAILKFNLPDDDHEFQMATNSARFHSVLWEMDQWLRSNTKHAPDSMSEDTYKAYKKCREKLHEFMNDETVSFD